MKIFKLVLTFTLATGLFSTSVNLFAHGVGVGDSMDEFMVTRHFTGAWDQFEQESQGLSIEVIERTDDSRKAVVYWYTYGNDGKTAWYVGTGNLVDNRIELNLKDSVGVEFMETNKPGNESVHKIGTMTIVFDSCNSGVVSFETDHEEVGSGSFNIRRLTEIMNTHCSGGISDDMHADAMYGEQRIGLLPAREGITGSGHARYEDYPGHMEFEVDVEGLPDGDYRLYVGMQDRGGLNVHEGHGNLEFRSPGETGSRMMTFDPRGMQIEIHDAQGVALSSLDNRFEQDTHSHHGEGDGHGGDNDHNYDCEFGMGTGHGMGHGMTDCVDQGEFIEIEIGLENTGIVFDAKGEAGWQMNSDRVEFSVEIESVSVGSYVLKVGGIEVGIIEAFEMHDGEVYGHIKFRDPETHGREHLDFEPRGEKVEVLQGDRVILEAQFPLE